jgi:ATP-dependent Clp protease adapter protein ClpS
VEPQASPEFKRVLQRAIARTLATARSTGQRQNATDSVVAPTLQANGIEEMTIVLVNDDFTPMEFVVGVLQDHFGLDLASATQVMLDIHNEGRAVCGRFPAGVAAHKVERVRAAAIQAGHPLRCVVEAR